MVSSGCPANNRMFKVEVCLQGLSLTTVHCLQDLNGSYNGETETTINHLDPGILRKDNSPIFGHNAVIGRGNITEGKSHSGLINTVAGHDCGYSIGDSTIGTHTCDLLNDPAGKVH